MGWVGGTRTTLRAPRTVEICFRELVLTWVAGGNGLFEDVLASSLTETAFDTQLLAFLKEHCGRNISEQSLGVVCAIFPLSVSSWKSPFGGKLCALRP
jgi:hypothetical protein